MRAPAASAALLGRNVILELTPFETRRAASGRGPLRVFASDADGNTITLIYFNNPGWAKKSLPLGEKRIVSGKLEAYGDEWQIIHPEVLQPGKGAEPALREPVYPLTEGHHQPPHARAGARGAGARARACPNGSSRACCRARAGGRGARHSPRRIATRARQAARNRLAYDEIFANQLALLLLRQAVAAPARTCRCRATGG